VKDPAQGANLFEFTPFDSQSLTSSAQNFLCVITDLKLAQKKAARLRNRATRRRRAAQHGSKKDRPLFEPLKEASLGRSRPGRAAQSSPKDRRRGARMRSRAAFARYTLRVTTTAPTPALHPSRSSPCARPSLPLGHAQSCPR